MNRRGFLGALAGIVAAPAIVRYSSLMTPRVVDLAPLLQGEIGTVEGVIIRTGAHTNFAQLTAAQKRLWSEELWRQCRTSAFLSRFIERADPGIIHAQAGPIVMARPALPTPVLIGR